MNLVEMFQSQENKQSYSANAWLFHEGTPGDIMYVLLEGEVEISVRGQVLVEARPGDLLGEMALIDAKSRSASAQAKSDCVVAPISESGFLDLVQHKPEFSIHVMRVLADRLRKMLKRV